jgi:hypothetical protein
MQKWRHADKGNRAKYPPAHCKFVPHQSARRPQITACRRRQQSYPAAHYRSEPHHVYEIQRGTPLLPVDPTAQAHTLLVSIPTDTTDTHPASTFAAPHPTCPSTMAQPSRVPSPTTHAADEDMPTTATNAISGPNNAPRHTQAYPVLRGDRLVRQEAQSVLRHHRHPSKVIQHRHRARHC